MSMKCVGFARTRTEEKQLIPLTEKADVLKAITERKQLYIIQAREDAGKLAGLTLGYFQVRVNGAVKTWKTRPNDWELPCKYGLKECFRVSHASQLRDGTGVLAIEE